MNGLAHRQRADLAAAWLVASAFSGAPSTLWALLIGADPLEATRAAGAMLVSPSARPGLLFAAAALVHLSISLFWTVVVGITVPRRFVVSGSIAAAAVIACIDLLLVAPHFFPAVAALAFWPQFADHLLWGFLVGATLKYRWKAG